VRNPIMKTPFLFSGPSFPSWATVAHENLGNDSSKEPLYVRWLYTAAAQPVTNGMSRSPPF
jgi:hypothetical protein